MASLRPAARKLIASRATLPRTYATQVSWKDSDFKPSSDPQLNGYPDFLSTSYQLRPPKGWDDVQERRNIGEPVPAEYEAISMWTPDPPTVAPPNALRQLAVAVAGFVAFGVFAAYTTPERVTAPRDYPYDGLVKELGNVEQNKAVAESIEGEAE